MTHPRWLHEAGVTYLHLDESSTPDGTSRTAPQGSVECRYLWLCLSDGLVEGRGTGRIAIPGHGPTTACAAFLNLLAHWNRGLDDPSRAWIYAPLGVARRTFAAHDHHLPQLSAPARPRRWSSRP
jgi:hypothetical protein